MQTHSFNVNVAQKLGVNKAILLQYIDFWVEKNRANAMGLYDGKVWVYHTIEAFLEIFPYFTKSSLSRYLRELQNEGYIASIQNIKKSQNNVKYYTILPKYYELTKMGIDDSKMGNPYNDISVLKKNILSSLELENNLEKELEKESAREIDTNLEAETTNDSEPPSKLKPDTPASYLDVRAEFEQIFALYPRKSDKLGAWEEFRSLPLSERAIVGKAIEARLPEWRELERKGEGKFIPLLKNFLRKKLYEECATAPPRKPLSQAEAIIARALEIKVFEGEENV